GVDDAAVAQDAASGSAPTASQPAPPPDLAGPAPDIPASVELSEREIPKSGIYADYVPPFPSEELSLSAVLEESVGANIDLAVGDLDIKISEAQVLVALGAYDVFLTAGLNASYVESPQRGSAFTFNLAQRLVGGNVGFRRALETGGAVELSLG